MLCALRSCVTEPGSLKRGCFTQFSFQKLPRDDFCSTSKKNVMRPDVKHHLWFPIMMPYEVKILAALF